MDVRFEPAATVSLIELRRRLSYYLDLVIERGPVVVTRRTEPYVVLFALKTIVELIEQAKANKGNDDL